MNLPKTLFLAFLAMPFTALQAQQALHFDMSLTGGQITESVSQQSFTVQSQLPACTATGIDGQALRFDGYSNYVKAAVPTSGLSTAALTVSVVLAAESYPMMQVDVAETTPTYATIFGNLVDKKGFALQLSSQGDLRFQFGSAYANGYLFTVNGTQKLPRGKWCMVTAVLDKAGNAAKLYLDGKEIGTSRMSRSDMVHSTTEFYIGKDATDLKSGPFLINTFCGLIDDISISNEVTDFTLADPVDYSQFPSPDFSYPASRYESSLWRPQFHAMPSGSWTNETHGMLYSGGRDHLFFQKNANGPYMSRLHWGHISSENLYDWRDEPIAIYPGEDFDLKGCWSGCVYTDGGTPYILYTAVDNAKARIVQAKATDEALDNWGNKAVVIDGRPAGLSDDFRDPYWFEAGGQQYIIVGTGKNGIGACTLHKLQNGTWTNDGTIFYQGNTVSQHGTFWEMPNVTPLGDGKYLFTCTPLGTAQGVRTLCWVGTIGSDGKFKPQGDMQYLEMGGISRDGYGLLSPTIYQKDGKTLLLGIVPDKLPTQTNFEMGWAHNYSLPREISLAADGSLVQKPYSGLSAMRSETAFQKQLSLQGSESLQPVSGRQIEMRGEFTIATGTSCGFRFLKSGNRGASLTYEASTGILTLDLTSLSRTSNDGGSYSGIYSAALPEKVKTGEKLVLHVFLDGSIADIFVCDRWAFSVRLFPTDANAVEAEAFANQPTDATLQAWTLDVNRDVPEGIHGVDYFAVSPSDHCYDLQGRRLTSVPQKGIYIKNGRKHVKF